MALGLEYLVTRNRAELADGAINRANQVGLSHGPCTGLQGAGKKVVKAGVTGDVAVQSLVHVDAVFAYKAANDLSRDPAALVASDPAGECGECLLGDQILGEYG